ncbi:MAG: hypothetical protein WCL00_16240 [Bacteroidota bacterium]
MEKIKGLLPSTNFIMGLALGILLFATYSFTKSTPVGSPPETLTSISVSDANILVKHYLATASIPTIPVKGFTLDTLQLNAMKLILKENPNLAGFRVYLGKDMNGVMAGIVTGVDNKGSDAITNTIYKTYSVGVGPCPIVCDVKSPITKE